MIYAAKKTKKNILIGSAYLSKGIVYYGLKKQKDALDHYIIANNYISRTHDGYLIHKVNYHIGLVKYYLGYYDEAISYFKECIAYFKTSREHLKEGETRPYLNSLHSLSVCYNKIGNYGLCSETNRTGLSESKRLNNDDMQVYFLHSEGINQYFKANFDLAIRKLNASLPAIKSNKDFGNEAVAYFYLGKSFQSLKKQEKALFYFEKVDQAFIRKGYIRPDLREAYELLISYYKETHDLTKQLYYIDQLLKADALLDTTYAYLTRKLHKEYDTKQLLYEKKHVQQQLIRQKYYVYLLWGTVLILCFFLFLVAYKRKQYKKKFKKLMLEKDEAQKSKAKTKINSSQLSDIAPETVVLILKQLDKFEQEKKFLAKDLKLSTLAAACKSNTTYLSQIISHHKGKSFNEYINDLKIDYIIALLKENKKVRNYTNTALADEAGFSTTQRFVHAFKTRAKMPPSYFTEQLKKELSKTSEDF